MPFFELPGYRPSHTPTEYEWARLAHWLNLVRLAINQTKAADDAGYDFFSETLTITAGAITLTNTRVGDHALHDITLGAGTLNTISGGSENDEVRLHPTGIVNLTNAGNLKIGFATPFVLQATDDVAHFVKRGSNWNALALRNNG